MTRLRRIGLTTVPLLWQHLVKVFSSYRDAEDAVKKLNGTEICGRRARVEMAKARDDNKIGTGLQNRDEREE